MLADQFIEAAQTAPHSRAVDELARLTGRALGEGRLSDAEASAVFETLAARRRAFAAGGGFARPRAEKAAGARPWPARRSPRSPDRQASIERRRRQAASGALPPALAAQFTTGEIAALAVVARQFQRNQVCVLCVDAIAALAGVSRSTVKNAIRQARTLGLLEVRERRRPGWPSLTNVVKVASKEWLAWLRLGAGRVGVKKLTATDTVFLARGKSQVSGHGVESAKRREGGARGLRGGASGPNAKGGLVLLT